MCVGGELHEMGVRMVADFFEMDGWDSYYLGANTPPAGVLASLRERPVDVVGISATMTFHVRRVASLIEQIRAADLAYDVKVLVGGYPFNIAPDLWQEIGADGYAASAEHAVDLANQLV
jgi:methylmalonyl-CoA mutase cobalamin-binding domain/chain